MNDPRLFLVKIVCLDACHFEVRAETDACAAIVHAMDRYPRACSIGAQRLGCARHG